MMVHKPFIVLASAVLLAPMPATAQSTVPDSATGRLDACLRAGAGGAPRSSLVDAVIALRVLCGAQIDELRRERLLEAGLDPRDDDHSEENRDADLRDEIVRRLNDEIAIAVANYTGLTLNDN